MGLEKSLPQDWVIKRLIDIAEDNKNAIVDGPFGSNLKVSDYIEGTDGVPVLTTKNLEGIYTNDSLRFISFRKFEELRRSEVRAGDILVAKIGSCGKTGIYPDYMPSAIIPANLLKISVSPEINKFFVYYYLNSPQFRNLLSGITTATAQPAFAVTKFRTLPIPLPNRTLQEKTVEKIEELFSQLDAGVAGLKRMQELLNQYRASVLKAAFEGRLVPQDPNDEPNIQISSNLPSGWKWVRISDVADINKRADILNELNDDLEITFVPMASVDAVTGVISTPVIKKLGEVKKGYTSFIEGDVIFAKITPCMENGKAAIARNLLNRIGFGSTEFHVLRANPLVLPEWLYYFLRQESFRRNAKANFTGTAGQMRVPKQFLIDHIIPLPPIYEQRRIVDLIESITSLIEEIGRLASANIIRADRLRQTILKSAFEGKLVQ